MIPMTQICIGPGCKHPLYVTGVAQDVERMSDELRRVGCYFTVAVADEENRVRMECRCDGSDEIVADIFAHNSPLDAVRALDYLVSLAFLRIFGAKRAKELRHG